MNSQKVRNFLIILSLIYGCTLFYLKSPLAELPSWFLWDLLTQWRLHLESQRVSQKALDLPIVLVVIDHESTQKLNLRWPWDREILARALDQMVLYEPKAVAIDLAFFGESESRESDERLAEALKKFPSVVLGSFFDEGGHHRLPYPAALEAVEGVGFINLPISRDGIIREQTVVSVNERGEVIAPSFALAAMMAYHQTPASAEIFPAGAKEIFKPYRVRVGAGSPFEKNLRTDSLYRVGTPYLIHPSRFLRVPFWKALAGDPILEQLRGKLILMGMEDPLFKDIHRTPVGPFSGLTIHAVNSLIYLNVTPIGKASRLVAMLFFMGLIFFSCFVLVNAKRWVSVSLLGLLMLGAFGLSAFFFFEKHIYIDTSFSILGVGLSLILTIIYEDTSRFVEIMRLRRELAHDDLTQAFAFHYFELLTPTILKRTQRGEKTALLIVDVDRFKEINDEHGHAAGNEVLKLFVQALQGSARFHLDVVARFGGDEFCILLPKTASNFPKIYLARVRESIRQKACHSPHLPPFTFSSGCAFASYGRNQSLKELFSIADQALYEAKKRGRNQDQKVEEKLV